MSERTTMALIEREALLAEINKWPESVMYKDWVQSAIASAPVIDAAPVVHGRWIHMWDESDVGYDTCQCSNCKTYYVVDWDFEKPRFCPNCGARMDGGKKS